MIEKAAGEMDTVDSIDAQIEALKVKREEMLKQNKSEAIKQCKKLIKEYGITYSNLKSVLTIRTYNKKS